MAKSSKILDKFYKVFNKYNKKNYVIVKENNDSYILTSKKILVNLKINNNHNPFAIFSFQENIKYFPIKKDNFVELTTEITNKRPFLVSLNYTDVKKIIELKNKESNCEFKKVLTPEHLIKYIVENNKMLSIENFTFINEVFEKVVKNINVCLKEKYVVLKINDCITIIIPHFILAN